ncbi:serine protease MucD [soil metagenome]
MKKHTQQILTFASMGLVTMTTFALAEEAKPVAETKQKITAGEFQTKISHNSDQIPNSGQVVMSYADVVQRILPSVVSIGTYSSKPLTQGGMPGVNEEDLDQLPPMFREFFKEWMERGGGAPDGQAPGKGNKSNPHGRQRPSQSQKPQQTGLGSGVILTEDGYIMTNNHVVENADELKVTIGGKGKEYLAKVIGTDPSTDVALIKIEATGLPHATFGDSTKLRVGDVVLAVGSPMGLDQSVTQGIVSAKGRSRMGVIASKGTAGYEDFIQTDAAINPGNSGGPLVDAAGRVIGINTAIETRSGMFSGIGLAIPINMALSVATDLLDDGKVDRGFLGIQMDPVEPSMADFLGLKDETGVTVTRVVDDSPAAKAGFEEGDVVVSANGDNVEEPSKLRLMISSKPPGESVKFGVVRFNEKSKKPETMELVATLEKLQADKLSASFQSPQKNKADPKVNAFIEGVDAQNLTEDLRKEFSIAEDVQGVVVITVDEKSPAARVGLQEGDVIQQVNRQAVKSVAEARANMGEEGNAVQLKILRNGQMKFLIIKK